MIMINITRMRIDGGRRHRPFISAGGAAPETAAAAAAAAAINRPTGTAGVAGGREGADRTYAGTVA